MSRMLSRWIAGLAYPGRKARTNTRPLSVMQLECREVPTGLAGIGSGLVAQYYSDANLSTLVGSRVDAGVNFDWGTGSPLAALPADNFSARWVGKVQAQQSETYTFFTAADEGVRLKVGGQVLVDAWNNAIPVERAATIALRAGEVYDLELEYVDRVGAARVQLSWSSPSTPRAVVPAAQLYAVGGWLNGDIGTPPVAGSATATGANWTVRGSGSAAADQGHFAWTTLGGDGSVVARVAGSSAAGEAGVMARSNAGAGAAFAAVTVDAAGATFRFRAADGGSVGQVGLPGVAANSWVKLVRNGDLVSGYVSPTGTDGTWTLLGSAKVALGDTARVGMTSGSTNGVLNAATFTDVTVDRSVAIGANLDAVTDWSLANPFVNVFKQARTFQALTHAGKAAVDADGWATEDFETIVQSGALNAARVYNGVYKLSFTGRADVGLSVTPGAISNVVYNAATNTTTADVRLNASDADGGWYFILQFRNVSGVRDVKLIRPGYDANTTQVFTDQFLSQIGSFTTLRFMDWLRTNNSPVVNWADRARVTDATWSTDRGVPWEVIVQLANQTGKDAWVTVPGGATDDYVRQLATLLKGSLNADRSVYLEWSNEVWNGMFTQTSANYAAAAAEVAAGGSNLAYAGETAAVSSWDWAFRRVAQRIVSISNTFASVWGADAINGRVRPVLASQVAVPYILRTQLEYIDKVYGDPSTFLFGVAGAPYFYVGAADHGTNLSATDVLNALAAAIQENKTFLDEYAHLATYYGLRSLAYEGGPDTYGPNNIAAKKAASLDPRMKDLVVQYLTDWYARGGGLFNWFVAGPTNYDSQYGTWGLTNDVLNLTSPKYQGVEKVAAEDPVPVAIGTPVVGTVMARDSVNAPTADPYPRYLNANDYRDYLVRAPQAGTYNLVLNYAQVSAGGQVQILVNDRAVQTLTLAATGPGYDSLWAPNSFADAPAVPVALGEGLNVVRLRVVVGGYTLNTLTFTAPTGTPTTPTPPAPTPTNQAPTVSTPATATVTGKTLSLAATGADDLGAGNLTYTWSVVGTPPAPVAFSANGTNAAASTAATFSKAGSYALRVTATDAGGLTGTADVTVTVVQTLTGLVMSPGSVTLAAGATRAFVLAGTDQFGTAMATLPAATWTATAGAVTPAGVYTAPTAATTATVTATLAGLSASATVTVSSPVVVPLPSGTAAVNYGSGFTTTGLTRNGSAAVSGGRLRLTGGQNQAGSAFASAKVDVSRFATTFRFQMGTLNGDPWSLGDGLTFTLQNAAASALGLGGGGLGYQGIAKSVAVKFDAVNNAGEGVNSTGFYTDGAAPTVAATDLSASNLDLRSGHVFRVDANYDGTRLTVTIADETTGQSATQQYTVNLPAVLGGSAAYAGFTAGTGALAGTLDILSWTYSTAAAPTANQAPTVTASAATGVVRGTSVALTAVGADDGGAANLSYTWSVVGTPPAAVGFSANGTNAARLSTATFTGAGTYTLLVTALDAAGLASTADVTVSVAQTLTTLVVRPAASSMAASYAQQFTASGVDQFSQPMATPVAPTWSVTGGGTISASGLYTAPVAAAVATVRATVGALSATATVTVTAPTGGTVGVDFGGGFGSGSFSKNGSAKVVGQRLRLASTKNQAGSAFASTKVDVTKFTASFRFQASSLDGDPWSLGDGLTFTLQNSGATALGSKGGGLGYQGIAKSVAVKFDLTDNAGEGVNSTGLYANGSAPTGSAVGLDGTGLDLHSGHVFRVDMSYAGTALGVRIVDELTGKSATQTYAVDLSQVLGGTSAYAGFTAGTGALAGNIDILDWKYVVG